MRRALEPAMVGARFASVLARRPDLRGPLPRDFSARLEGQTVSALHRRGKYLLAELSSGDVLLMHLGMSGSFRIEIDDDRQMPGGYRYERSTEVAHDHVVFVMSSGHRITFNDPRRFGSMDIAHREALVRPSGHRHSGTRAARAGVRRGRPRAWLPPQEDLPQGRLVRSAHRRWLGEHLRVRSAASRQALAKAPRLHNRHTEWRAARHRRATGGRDQEGAQRRDRPPRVRNRGAVRAIGFACMTGQARAAPDRAAEVAFVVSSREDVRPSSVRCVRSNGRSGPTGLTFYPSAVQTPVVCRPEQALLPPRRRLAAASLELRILCGGDDDARMRTSRPRFAPISRMKRSAWWVRGCRLRTLARPRTATSAA